MAAIRLIPDLGGRVSLQNESPVGAIPKAAANRAYRKSVIGTVVCPGESERSPLFEAARSKLVPRARRLP